MSCSGVGLCLFSGILYGQLFTPATYIQDNEKDASQNGRFISGTYELLHNTPTNCICGRVYCFHVVRPSIRLSERTNESVSETFCLLNILKKHLWNFIKLCENIHMYKTTRQILLIKN